ncbi:MAG: lactate 2-monooxygenase [Cyclobacteriaceae bacterium]|nr:lactate 2-monooxygenase [Cyclobacteriaceae bacterium]
MDRQKEVYIQGIGGVKQKIPFDSKGLEATASKVMSDEAYAYIAGGAGDGLTMKNNLNAFSRYQIVPEMLKNVENRDSTIELFGKRHPSPFFLAPIGVLEMAHKNADIAVAKAAEACSIPYIFSNQASYPMEKVAKHMPTTSKWFQLYWSKSRELVKSLVQRAETCGCEAIVVTLDTSLLGWRTADLNGAYLPFLRGLGIAQYTSDPVFQKIIDSFIDNPEQDTKPPLNLKTLSVLRQMLMSYPDQGLIKKLKEGRARAAVKAFTQTYSNPALSWEDLNYLRKCTSLPILLKGILSPTDAQLAISYGMDGIIVSNHGGRQVDGSISALEALEKISPVINGQIPILMDSGIRTGADAFKAIALGANAVCIGRPYAYALAIGGEKGVFELLSNFKADFDLTMGLSGCKTIADVKKQVLLKS